MAQGQGSSGPTRRHVVKSGAALAVAAAVPHRGHAAAAQMQDHVAELNWLGGARAKVDAELVWGTPWPRGALRPSTQFQLSARSGRALPVQSWPLA